MFSPSGLVALLCLACSSCSSPATPQPSEVDTATKAASLPRPDTLPEHTRQDLVNGLRHSDEVWPGRGHLVAHYLKKYNRSTPDPLLVSHDFFVDVDPPQHLGDLRGDGRPDSVFFWGPLYPLTPEETDPDWERAGEFGYYFSDTALPRLPLDAGCGHPKHVFSVGDIDEDGVLELGLYYSSCVSRYKSLHVFRLQKKYWKRIASVTYDLGYVDTSRAYGTYVRKQGKGRFQMFEHTDLTEPAWQGRGRWISFRIK